MAKEVLMSRRNAPMDHIDATSFSRTSAGGTGSGLGAYQPPPISNYKGVMLCDRPVVKQPGQNAALQSGQPMPFSCSIGPMSKFEQLGLNPSREERAARLSMESKVAVKSHDDFFTKHRRWLAQLRAEKRKKDIENTEAQKAQDEKRKKFKEYSAKLRESIRAVKADESGGKLTMAAVAEHTAKAERDSKAATPRKDAESSKKKGKKGKEKPAWAMTEQQLEAKEDEDVDDLINFASGLDYEKFIDDWEVRSALAAVKDRISQLAEAKRPAGEGSDKLSLPEGDEEWKRTFAEEWNREEAEAIIAKAKQRRDRAGAKVAESVRSDVSGMSQVSASSRASNASRASRKSNASALSAVDEDAQSNADPTYKVAEHVLAENRQLRKVHSSHSVRAIIEKKKAARRQLDAVQEVPDFGPTQAAPVVVTYLAEDQGAGNIGKPDMDPSNLPYLHRNPAI